MREPTNLNRKTSSFPPGYLAGYTPTYEDRLIRIAPGIAVIANITIFYRREYIIQPEDWKCYREASADVYIYLTEEGRFEVHSLSPVFNEKVGNESHPTIRSIHTGTITLASDKSISEVTGRS